MPNGESNRMTLYAVLGANLRQSITAAYNGSLSHLLAIDDDQVRWITLLRAGSLVSPL
jgi:hypothetical protein